MNLLEKNSLALEALAKGEFDTAQTLFKENCKSGNYRAYNNLGYFYIENGMTKKGGATVSGVGYGKHYIRKAYGLKQTGTVLLNMAMVLAEYEKQFDAACRLYRGAYEQKPEEDVFYNMAACLYLMGEYRAALDLFREPPTGSSDLFLLYCFSLLPVDKERLKAFLQACDIRKRNIDADFLISLLYFCEKDEITLSDIEDYLRVWSPDEAMWALVIDVLSERGTAPATIEEVIAKKTDGYFDGKKTYKKAMALLRSEEDRRNYIARSTYYRPAFKWACGYYGCAEHMTEW